MRVNTTDLKRTPNTLTIDHGWFNDFVTMAARFRGMKCAGRGKTEPVRIDSIVYPKPRRKYFGELTSSAWNGFSFFRNALASWIWGLTTMRFQFIKQCQWKQSRFTTRRSLWPKQKEQEEKIKICKAKKDWLTSFKRSRSPKTSEQEIAFFHAHPRFRKCKFKTLWERRRRVRVSW
jgi:hypothetical protein